jgi:hypothetical protein
MSGSTPFRSLRLRMVLLHSAPPTYRAYIFEVNRDRITPTGSSFLSPRPAAVLSRSSHRAPHRAVCEVCTQSDARKRACEQRGSSSSLPTPEGKQRGDVQRTGVQWSSRSGTRVSAHSRASASYEASPVTDHSQRSVAPVSLLVLSRWTGHSVIHFIAPS